MTVGPAFAGTFEGVDLYFTNGTANLTATKGSLYGQGVAQGPAILCTGQGHVQVLPASLQLSFAWPRSPFACYTAGELELATAGASFLSRDWHLCR